MPKRRYFSRWTMGAFIIFLLSSVLAGLLSSQMGTVSTALSVTATSSQSSEHKPLPTPIVRISSPVAKVTPTASILTFIVAGDNFDRSNQMFWGTSSRGIHWEGEANVSRSFSIQDRSGHVSGQGSFFATTQPNMSNMEVIITGSTNSFQGTTFGAILRWTNESTWYEASINGTSFSVLQRSNGLLTTLASTPFLAKPEVAYTLRCRVIHTTIYAKVWEEGTAEPKNWLITVNNATLQSGFGGTAFFLAKGSTVIINQYVVLGLLV